MNLVITLLSNTLESTVDSWMIILIIILGILAVIGIITAVVLFVILRNKKKTLTKNNIIHKNF